MSGPALVETPRPSIAEKNAGSEITVPTTPEAIHDGTAKAISSHLTQTGHPQTPEQVSAHGKANTVLAKIEDGGIGAQATELIDVMTRGAENTIGDFQGSARDYATEGAAGNKILKGRMSRKAIAARAAQKFINYLFKKRGS